ncbi:MAG TPA: endonuclease/exonuclease/phosphatase family protein [Streptosporangiaceae bacterium]|jgi:endonuclease/exonuclease/phosphatase family metal-dependent hydrolase|nr:endonuclease/exonuclease/phosphatase family protein [Streptosporangiaceae bacterium]
MSLRHLEWAGAAGLAGWAAVRLTGADRAAWAEALTVPPLSFTPQAASAAVAGALLMRDRGAAAVAGLAGAALSAAVLPRAVPRPRPDPAGPVLRVLTANLLHGRAAADAVVHLVGQTGADVLFVQELTGGAVARLSRAGLGDLLPYQVTQPLARDTGIYARHPLRPGPAGPARTTASLDLPRGPSVQVICVHATPPRRPSGAALWRAELADLPSPGDLPVIVAGDFNATLDHAQFRRLLRRGYTDAAAAAGRGLVPTWGPEPRGRPPLLTIDHVLTDARCAARTTSVHRLAGTDHRALFAELRLPR